MTPEHWSALAVLKLARMNQNRPTSQYGCQHFFTLESLPYSVAQKVSIAITSSSDPPYSTKWDGANKTLRFECRTGNGEIG